MAQFNLAVIVGFTLWGLVSTFPQQNRYVRMASANSGDSHGPVSTSLDSQQLKQTAVLGGPVRFLPGINRIKTNPESLHASAEPKSNPEILIDLYEHPTESPKRIVPVPAHMDLDDEDNPWKNEGKNSKSADASHSSNESGWPTEDETSQTGSSDSSTGSSWQNKGEHENSHGIDASHPSTGNEWPTKDGNSHHGAHASHPSTGKAGLTKDDNNSHVADAFHPSTGNSWGNEGEHSRSESSHFTSGSSTKDQQIESDDIRLKEKHFYSKGQQEAEQQSSIYNKKYNAASETQDDYGMMPNDRRAPVVVPPSEVASYWKAFNEGSGNHRRPVMKAAASFMDHAPYDEYESSATPHLLQLISSQQTELKELLIQIMFRQTTLRDDIHRIDQQLTHMQQGVGMPRAPYTMRSYTPAYRLG